jgi:hypothetical protein
MHLAVSRTWSVNCTYSCVARTNVGNIWSIVCVTNRSVVLSVRSSSYEAQIDCWSGKGHVERSVHEIRIPNIDKTCVVSIMSVSIVKNTQPSNLANPAASVIDQHIANLAYASIVVVINGNVLHLNNCSEIIVLNVRVVVVTRIKSHVYKTIAYG